MKTGKGRRFPRYGPARAGFLQLFHAMEDFLPQCGNLRSLWPLPPFSSRPDRRVIREKAVYPSFFVFRDINPKIFP